MHYLEQELSERIRTDPSFFDFLQRGSLDCIWYWDLENPDNRWMSPQFWTTLGYDQKEEKHLAAHWRDFIYPEDLQKALTNLKKHCADPNHPYDQVVRYRHKDGSTVWVRCRGLAIRDASGTPIRVLGSHTDLTALKRAQEALGERERQYHTLVNNIPDYVMRYDRQCRHVFGSAKAIHESGRIVENYVGKTHREMGFPDHLCTLWEKAIGRVFQTGEMQTEIFEWKSSKGVLLLEWRVLPEFSDDGSIETVLGISRDITERKKIEAQLRQAQKMEAIGNLAGGIAHDFNNILASVIGFTELALEDSRPGSLQEDNLQEVYKAGKRAKDLVWQILTFARQADEPIHPIHIKPIVMEALKLIRSSIPTTIDIKHTLGTDSFVMGNPTQIHQIIMNLCTNAAQAMDDSGGILEITMGDIEIEETSAMTEKGLNPGKYIELQVADTGAGIAPDVIGSIFEPYFTTKAPGCGTGLGLAVAQGIVEKGGGKILVESQAGKGTTFRVYFPVSKKQKVRHSYDSGDLPSGAERILFVDDETPIVKMGHRNLESLGYSVTARTSSIEALELFKSKPDDFDLVITDMTMPDMTGDELAAKLIDIKADIPVILCTGYSRKITSSSMAAIGIKAVVYKPAVKADLALTIRKVLDDAKNHPQKTKP